MSDRVNAKIIIVGPPSVGKSVISDFLSDFKEVPSDVYKPTKGVRIHEFERVIARPGKRSSVIINIQLWDVSGEKEYADCWPAIQQDVDGVIMVFNPEARQEQEVEQWFNEMVVPTGLPESAVIVCAHQGSSQNSPKKVKLARSLMRIPLYHTVLNSELKRHLDSLLTALIPALIQKRNDQENSIIG
eukprot:TRINITY_DN96_c0_g1_i2.p1 TRINITY_DN96_c0_g1~~TRINITY_DN96_c0_g1_i2.p1  ORF type:complete len:187 (-),score=19.24 TRINITY_DN96_c0_g1_i2:76-636(-)